MNRFQVLDWDSEFFGVTVAKILPDKLKTEELVEILASMNKKQIKLAYWASNPKDEESQNAARFSNGFLADKKVTYIVDIGHLAEPADSFGWLIEEYTDTLTNNDLESLAIQAGAYSRFKIDPRIPDGKFIDMYKQWIRKSVNRQIADAVLVARHKGKIVGMVTLGEKNSRGDIGLIAVDEDARGKNLGVALVSAAQEWARNKGFSTAQVVTQGENVAACKLYEKCGYRIDTMEHYYHFWI